MWLAAVTALLAVLATPPQTRDADVPFVIFAGDSRTDANGHCCGPTGTWPYILTQVSPFFAKAKSINIARNAYRTGDVLLQFAVGMVPPAEAPGHSYFLVWIGINDVSDGDAAEEIYVRLREIWGRARRLGYRVVAFPVGPTCIDPPTTKRVDAVNQMILDHPSRYDFFVDLDAWFFDCAEDRDSGLHELADGAHPSGLGETLIAQAVKNLFARVSSQ